MHRQGWLRVGTQQSAWLHLYTEIEPGSEVVATKFAMKMVEVVIVSKVISTVNVSFMVKNTCELAIQFYSKGAARNIYIEYF